MRKSILQRNNSWKVSVFKVININILIINDQKQLLWYRCESDIAISEVESHLKLRIQSIQEALENVLLRS